MVNRRCAPRPRCQGKQDYQGGSHGHGHGVAAAQRRKAASGCGHGFGDRSGSRAGRHHLPGVWLALGKDLGRRWRRRRGGRDLGRGRPGLCARGRGHSQRGRDGHLRLRRGEVVAPLLAPVGGHERHQGQAQIAYPRKAVVGHAAHCAQDHHLQAARDLGTHLGRRLEDSLDDVPHDGVGGRSGKGPHAGEAFV